MDLFDGPVHGSGHILVYMIEVFDETDLVAVATGDRSVREQGEKRIMIPEESDEFEIVHTSVDGAFGDLEAVDVYDGYYGSGFGWIDVFVSVPCAGKWLE